MKRPRSASEQFSVRFELAEVNEQDRTFGGMAMVFGAPIDCYPPSIVERGAFAKTIAEQGDRVKILWQHDVHEPIGRPVELRETEWHLRLRAALDPIPLGDRVLAQIKSGTLTDLSIGFDPIKWEMIVPDKDFAKRLEGYGATPEAVEKFSAMGEPVRVIREVRLWEVSVVTFGAQPAAKIGFAATAFRNLPVAEGLEWDSARARTRVLKWAGEDAEKLSRAFLACDGMDHRLQIADVQDGRLVAVPGAVYEAALAVVAGAVPEGVEEGYLREHLESYYAKMGRSAPWQFTAARSILEPAVSLPTDQFDGRKLSSKNADALRQAWEWIGAVLAEHDSREEEKRAAREAKAAAEAAAAASGVLEGEAPAEAPAAETTPAPEAEPAPRDIALKLMEIEEALLSLR